MFGYMKSIDIKEQVYCSVPWLQKLLIISTDVEGKFGTHPYIELTVWKTERPQCA